MTAMISRWHGSRTRGPLARGLSCLAAALACGAGLAAQSTLRVSVDSNGAAGSGLNDAPAISGDGRWTAFASLAEDLVPGDGNGVFDVFVHDSESGTTERASVSTAGAEADGPSGGVGNPGISADGRFVVFDSLATNLVANDTNGVRDVFVRDRLTGTTRRASVSSSGAQASAGSDDPAISADGRYVVFSSAASDLDPADTNGFTDVFRHDLLTGATIIASLSSSGAAGFGVSAYADVSADGWFVTFANEGDTLAPGDANGTFDVYVRDTLTGTTTRVSVDDAGAAANGIAGGGVGAVAISADGRFVAFDAEASNLVAGDANQTLDVFVHDRAAGTTVCASVATSGAPSNGGSFLPAISADGRYVAFASAGTDLAAGDTNGSADIFVRDLVLSTTTLATVGYLGGAANSATFWPSLSGDGRRVAFTSLASNLIPDDADHWDAFVRDLTGCSPSIATYCVAGTTSHGCVPSISGSGLPSASAGSGFVIQVDAVEGGRDGIVFYGISGPDLVPFGGGTSFLCVRQPLQRTGVLSSGGAPGSCDGALSIDWNLFLTAHSGPLGAPFFGGKTVWAQAWFRDPGAPGGTNLSDGLWFTVCP